MRIEKDFSLKNYNTFKIDVLCRFFAEFSDETELLNILQNKNYKAENKLPLGVGSNILFTRNYDGLVLKNEIKGIEFAGEDENYAFVKAGGGVIWDDLVDFALAGNLGGVENLAAIPGTVGASPVQNIGAYGQEAGNAIHETAGLFIASGEKFRLTRQQCGFGYRNSAFKNRLKGECVITEVTFKLKKNPLPNCSYGDIKKELEELNLDDKKIQNVSRAIRSIRQRKLPDPGFIGSAGSFFKNPEIDGNLFSSVKEEYPEIPGYPAPENRIKVPAAWLIEQAGWKGKEELNAATYKNQPLVIINKGNASGSEILEFSGKIKNAVFKKFSIHLEEEVNII